MEFFDVPGSEVSELPMLGVSPDLLDRIEFRGVGREVLHANGVIVLAELLFRGAMNAGAIPDNQKLATELPAELTHERDDVVGADVAGVNLEVEPGSRPVGRKSYGADDRKSIMPCTDIVDWGLASGSPGATHSGLQHEPALIDENDASPLLLGFFLYSANARGETRPPERDLAGVRAALAFGH